MSTLVGAPRISMILLAVRSDAESSIGRKSLVRDVRTAVVPEQQSVALAHANEYELMFGERTTH